MTWRVVKRPDQSIVHIMPIGDFEPHDEDTSCRCEPELEPVDDGVRIRTDLAAVGEDSQYASTQDLYVLWPRLQCPVLLLRASRPMAPGGGLVVSQADADRFAAKASDAAGAPDVTVVEVDADHYSILTSPPAIRAVEQFVGSGAV